MGHDGEKQTKEEHFNSGKMHSTMQQPQTYWLGVRRFKFMLYYVV